MRRAYEAQQPGGPATARSTALPTTLQVTPVDTL